MNIIDTEKQNGENVFIQTENDKMTKISIEDNADTWNEIVEANQPKNDHVGSVLKSLKGEYHLSFNLSRKGRGLFRKIHNDTMREAKKAEEEIRSYGHVRDPYIDWKISYYIKDCVIRSLKGQTIKEQLRAINSFNNLCPGRQDKINMKNTNLNNDTIRDYILTRGSQIGGNWSVFYKDSIMQCIKGMDIQTQLYFINRYNSDFSNNTIK